MESRQVLTLLTVKFTPEVVNVGKTRIVHIDNNVANVTNVSNVNNLRRRRGKIEKYQSWILAVLLLVLWLTIAYLAQTNLLRARPEEFTGVRPEDVSGFPGNKGIKALIIQAEIQLLG